MFKSKITHKYIHIPVGKKGVLFDVRLSRDQQIVRYFNCQACAPEEADFIACLPVEELLGHILTVEVLPREGGEFQPGWLSQSDQRPAAPVDSARPLVHFAAEAGWLNDPNGLCFLNGEYHLFYQYNPFGTGWGNMHWGHATSPDLLHWAHHDIALFPDERGSMYSGSAVVDAANLSGLGENGIPPLLLFYTAAGDHAPLATGYTQNLAYSTDAGKTFRKYAGNPLIPEMHGGNRDPKVVYDPASGLWLLALYLTRRESQPLFAIFTSPDLLHWTKSQELLLPGSGECPDLFPLAPEDDPAARKWIFMAADGHYRIGALQNGVFLPEAGPYPFSLHSHDTLYAPQTWFHLPDNRRVQISWLRGNLPSARINQAMSLPVTLHLRHFPDGLRLCADPVEEIEGLRRAHPSWTLSAPLCDNAVIDLPAEANDVCLCLRRDGAFTLLIRDIPLGYNPAEKTLRIGPDTLAVPELTEEWDLRLILDRNSLELFAGRGRYYLGKGGIFTGSPLRITMLSGAAALCALDVWALEAAMPVIS